MLSAINYHYVRRSFDQPFPAYFGMTPQRFVKQLQLIGSKGRFLHPDTLASDSKAIFESPEHFYLVTFDDGLREQVETALPLLDECGIPALFFINSINHVEKKVSLVHKIHLVRSQIDPDALLSDLRQFTGRSLDASQSQQARLFYRFDSAENAEIKYLLNVIMDHQETERFIDPVFSSYFSEKDVVRELYMDADQLKQLRSRNFLGNHTHSHLLLGKCGEDKIADEIRKTNDFLNAIEKKEIAFISYPYGTQEAVTEIVTAAAAQAGHKFGFTTTPGINDGMTQNLTLKRFDCNDLTA